MLQINSYPSAMFLPAFANDPPKTRPLSLRHWLCFSCVCAHAFVVVAASLPMFWSLISVSSVRITLYVTHRLLSTGFCCAATIVMAKEGFTAKTLQRINYRNGIGLPWNPYVVQIDFSSVFGKLRFLFALDKLCAKQVSFKSRAC